MLSNSIRELEKYRKGLGEITFSVVLQRNGRARVKLGKKYNIVDAPDKESGEYLALEFTTVAKKQQERVDEILRLLEQKCEQLSLFTKNAEDQHGTTAGSGGEGSGSVLNADSGDSTGKELS